MRPGCPSPGSFHSTDANRLFPLSGPLLRGLSPINLARLRGRQPEHACFPCMAGSKAHGKTVGAVWPWLLPGGRGFPWNPYQHCPQSGRAADSRGTKPGTRLPRKPREAVGLSDSCAEPQFPGIANVHRWMVRLADRDRDSERLQAVARASQIAPEDLMATGLSVLLRNQRGYPQYRRCAARRRSRHRSDGAVVQVLAGHHR